MIDFMQRALPRFSVKVCTRQEAGPCCRRGFCYCGLIAPIPYLSMLTLNHSHHSVPTSDVAKSGPGRTWTLPIWLLLKNFVHAGYKCTQLIYFQANKPCTSNTKPAETGKKQRLTLELTYVLTVLIMGVVKSLCALCTFTLTLSECALPMLQN